MQISKNKWFTLVELIVVITILAILWAIAFISLQWYSTDARDSARITDISSIRTSLELYHLEAWKYPNPTNWVDITFSWSDVWKQWTFGETVFTNTDKLDKIPLDPVTNKEYTYSITSNKNEYQIWGIMEGDTIVMNNEKWIVNNLSFSEANAWTIDATAYVAGTYNWLMTKSNSWVVCKVLSVPTIITNDTSSTDLQTIIDNNRFVYRWYKNLPATYKNSKFNNEWGFPFVPNNLVAYTDNAGCSELTNASDPSARVILIQWLQDSYSGSIIQNEWEIANINSLSIDINNPSTEVLNYSNTFVNNVLGAKLATTSSLPILTQEQTYSSCNFNWDAIVHDTAVTAYQTASVSFWNSCTSEQRTCNDWVLNWSYTFSACSVSWATGTFTLSQNTVTKWTSVTISNTCSQAPSSYTSSNTSVATISGNTITTVWAWTTNITPVWWACANNTSKSLTVNDTTYSVTTCPSQNAINNGATVTKADILANVSNYIWCTLTWVTWKIAGFTYSWSISAQNKMVLIMATSNIAWTSPWWASVDIPGVPNSITNANMPYNIAWWDWYANTQSVLAVQWTSTTTYAAQKCNALGAWWYLPASEEMVQIYCYSDQASTWDAYYGSALNWSDCANKWYSSTNIWSLTWFTLTSFRLSNEVSNTYANSLNISSGYRPSSSKSNNHAVRCVSRF